VVGLAALDPPFVDDVSFAEERDMVRPQGILNLIVLRSRDLDHAAVFYRALGLEFIKHAHGDGPIHLASESANQVFEIYPLADGDVPTSSTRIGFAVGSVDESYQALLEAGGQSVSPPKNSAWGVRAVVADPDGHRVELTSVER
jgi:catechol 2,3-dioxygenase-like lactoylglutathione lyase family enzyme